jgi:hypothetical protein
MPRLLPIKSRLPALPRSERLVRRFWPTSSTLRVIFVALPASITALESTINPNRRRFPYDKGLFLS